MNLSQAYLEWEQKTELRGELRGVERGKEQERRQIVENLLLARFGEAVRSWGLPKWSNC